LGEIGIQSYSRIGIGHDECEILSLSHLGSARAHL